MRIGVLRETRDQETRVGLTPAGVRVLVDRGNTVTVENGAGTQSGFSDEAYALSGARLSASALTIAQNSELLLLIHPPNEMVLSAMAPGSVVMAYWYLAIHPERVFGLVEQGLVPVGYDTIQNETGRPVLNMMSTLVGRLALSVIRQLRSGKPVASLSVIGGGALGQSAAWAALSYGARVQIFTRRPNTANFLTGRRGVILYSSEDPAMDELLAPSDAVISAVSIPGSRAPYVLRPQQMASWKPGTILMDCSVTEGGSVKPDDDRRVGYPPQVQPYENPIIAALAPETASLNHTKAIMPYLVRMSTRGLHPALKELPDLNISVGHFMRAAKAQVS